MKILFLGDIVGKSARNKVKDRISSLKQKYSPHVIIANAVLGLELVQYDWSISHRLLNHFREIFTHLFTNST